MEILKKKIDKKIVIIIILVIILAGIIYIYISDNTDTINQGNISTNINQNTTKKETTTISTQGEINSGLEENIELHATYYFKKIYAEENKYIKQGNKILEYTNGTYLVAPYDCVITAINIPEAEEKCTNEHYITIKSTNILTMSMNIDETEIDKISIGQEANLYVNNIDKDYTGYVTKISSTASNGKFTIISEFENDGDIKIGMTGKCTINVIQ